MNHASLYYLSPWAVLPSLHIVIGLTMACFGWWNICKLDANVGLTNAWCVLFLSCVSLELWTAMWRMLVQLPRLNTSLHHTGPLFVPPLRRAGNLCSMWNTQHRTQKGHAGDRAHHICNMNMLVKGKKLTFGLVRVWRCLCILTN